MKVPVSDYENREQKLEKDVKSSKVQNGVLCFEVPTRHTRLREIESEIGAGEK